MADERGKVDSGCEALKKRKVKGEKCEKCEINGLRKRKKVKSRSCEGREAEFTGIWYERPFESRKERRGAALPDAAWCWRSAAAGCDNFLAEI
jgi:hypothetical protein